MGKMINQVAIIQRFIRILKNRYFLNHHTPSIYYNVIRCYRHSWKFPFYFDYHLSADPSIKTRRELCSTLKLGIFYCVSDSRSCDKLEIFLNSGELDQN